MCPQPEIRNPSYLFRVECSFLKRNFLNCLRDKAARDQVPYMTCDNEHVPFNSIQILWFNLECPEDFQQFQNPQSLRKIFTQ